MLRRPDKAMAIGGEKPWCLEECPIVHPAAYTFRDYVIAAHRADAVGVFMWNWTAVVVKCT